MLIFRAIGDNSNGYSIFGRCDASISPFAPIFRGSLIYLFTFDK